MEFYAIVHQRWAEPQDDEKKNPKINCSLWIYLVNPCCPNLKEKTWWKEKQCNICELRLFSPLFWSLQIKWCWSACWSALQQQERLLKTKATGTALTVFKFVSWKMQWLYISILTPRSTCLFLWSLKRDKKITLEIREQHGKLKLNVQSARKLILTTKPCKDTFGISMLGKWRLLYPQADTSREPV